MQTVMGMDPRSDGMKGGCHGNLASQAIHPPNGKQQAMQRVVADKEHHSNSMTT